MTNRSAKLISRDRRVLLTGDTASPDPAYHHLREITRCRRTLVLQQTAASNRIHALADPLFPGFLNASQSALTLFTDASLQLMKERFSAPEIAHRPPRRHPPAQRHRASRRRRPHPRHHPIRHANTHLPSLSLTPCQSDLRHLM